MALRRDRERLLVLSAECIGTIIDCQFSKELVKIEYYMCTYRASGVVFSNVWRDGS